MLVLHTTRGILRPALDEARAMHNAFVAEGPQPGIEIARSLGDISHNVYAPTQSSLFGVRSDELLFIDQWANPDGMEQFFSNPFAQEAGDRLFLSREESEWMPAPAAFSFHVAAPAGTTWHFIRVLRAPARSAEEATAALATLGSANLGAARRRGQLSHNVFVRLGDVVAARPASNARRGERVNGTAVAEPVEILVVDSWATLEGMNEHYGDAAAMRDLEAALAGPPEASTWEQVSGFAEW